MKKNYPSLLLPSIILIFSACASLEGFQTLMDSQIGKPIAEVQQLFGFNFIERQLDNGNKAYSWYWTETGLIPGYETPTTIYSTRSKKTEDVIISPGTYFPPRYYEENCEFTFITDTQNTVTAWQARGNACASYPGPGPVLRSGQPLQ